MQLDKVWKFGEGGGKGLYKRERVCVSACVCVPACVCVHLCMRACMMRRVLVVFQDQIKMTTFNNLPSEYHLSWH